MVMSLIHSSGRWTNLEARTIETLVPSQHGVYSSFPCLALDRASGEVLLIYRQGVYNPDDPRPGMRAHGLGGQIWQQRRSLQGVWGTPESLFSEAGFEPGLIDATLTNLSDTDVLIIRRYPHTHPLFITTRSADTPYTGWDWPWEFPAQQVFDDYAHWGRMVEWQGRWLQVVYGFNDTTRWWTRQLGHQMPVEQAAVFESMDRGRSWRFVNFIGPTMMMDGDLSANETTLMAVGDRLFALMRTGWRWPGPMFLTTSDDGGMHWSTPTFTGLYGEAPMWRSLPDGRVLVAFRGFNHDSPKEGGTFSLAWFDPVSQRFSSERVIDCYGGNHYDGGYGDVIAVPNEAVLLASYYFSDDPTTRHPAIRLATIDLT